MDIKMLKDLFQLTIERGNLWKREDQIIYKRIMVDLGLLKSGKMELQSTIDRGNLRVLLGMHCKELTFIVHEISRIQNLLLEEHCAFWEVIHLFQ